MNKILVIQTASIGDVILATAVLEKIHGYHPGIQLYLLIKKGPDDLFEHHPFIHRLWVLDKNRKSLDLLRLLRELRKERYDLIINIQRFLATGLLTVLSGAKGTTGFRKNPLSVFYSKRFPHMIGAGIHETDRNQCLIADLTDRIPAKPRLYPSGQTVHAGSGIYYTVSPASLWFTKQFPPGRWAGLIAKMPSDATVYLLGSGKERALCEEIVRLAQTGEESRRKNEEGKVMREEEAEIRDPGAGIRDPESGIRHQESGKEGPRIVQLAGEISLLETAALMQGARMNFTNDSAPLHLASSVNAPVVAVYCSTIPAFGFGPLSEKSAIVEVGESLSCRPCGLHGRKSCPEQHFRCATGIQPAQLEAWI